MTDTEDKNKVDNVTQSKEEKISHYKGKFQDSMYVKASKPPKQKRFF